MGALLYGLLVLSADLAGGLFMVAVYLGVRSEDLEGESAILPLALLLFAGPSE